MNSTLEDDGYRTDDNLRRDDGNEIEDSEDEIEAYEIVNVPDENGHTLEMVQRQLRDTGRIVLRSIQNGSQCTDFYNGVVLHSTTRRTKGRVVTSFRQFASWMAWFKYCDVETQTVTYKDKRGLREGALFPNGFVLSGGYYYPTLSDWLVLEKVLALEKSVFKRIPGAEATRTAEAGTGRVALRHRRPGFR